MAIKNAKVQTPRTRTEWIKLVEQTIAEISRWAATEKWPVVELEKEVEEQGLGTYSVPVLFVQLPGSRLHVEPIARYVGGADGRIDLRSVETLNRVTLLRKGGTWVIRTDSGIDYPKRWSRATFAEVAQALGKPT